MQISSPDFKDGQKIPSKFTCDGENVNPTLLISDVPENAKSLSLIVDDPDSPSGTWTHWLVWNIPTSMSGIAQNSVPGVEGTNTFGNIGYGGPCPGSGEHRYVFKLFALDTTLVNESGANINEIQSSMKGHIIAKAQVVGKYQKQ